MAIDKKLLRAAWPKGYLAMRGVYTIEGWLFSSDCLIFSEYGFYKRAVCERTSCVVHKAGTNNHVVQGWIDEGDLLPNVDPSDTATWACLLKDLAEAAGLSVEQGHISFARTAGNTAFQSWCIKVENFILPRMSTGVVLGLAEVENPGEALVRARIQMRETANGD